MKGHNGLKKEDLVILKNDRENLNIARPPKYKVAELNGSNKVIIVAPLERMEVKSTELVKINPDPFARPI